MPMSYDSAVSCCMNMTCAPLTWSFLNVGCRGGNNWDCSRKTLHRYFKTHGLQNAMKKVKSVGDSVVLVVLVDLGQDVATKLKASGRIEIANLFFTPALTLVGACFKAHAMSIVQSTWSETATETVSGNVLPSTLQANNLQNNTLN